MSDLWIHYQDDEPMALVRRRKASRSDVLEWLEAQGIDAVRFSQVVHDAQDEHGHDTRHDIGLVIWEAMEGVGE